MRIREAVLAAAVLGVAISGCGADEPVGTIPSSQVAALVPRGATVADVLESGRLLAGLRGDLYVQCMSKVGFPQPRRAVEMREPVPPVYRIDPLRIIPIDLGPSTQAEADKYGFGGSTFPIGSGGTGVVISRSEDFDQASDRCQREIDARFSDLSPLQSAASEFQNTVGDYFLSVAIPAIKTSLRDRLECVRDRGYRGLDPRRAIQADTMTEILALAAVDPGQETTSYVAPSEADVKSGSVGVFPPAPVRTYETSPAEREFARAYVECGERNHFQQTLDRAAAHARARVEKRFHGAAAELGHRLSRLATELDASRSSIQSGHNQEAQ